MADQTLEINTTAEDPVAKQQVDEAEVSGPAAQGEPDGGCDVRNSPEKSSPAADSSWSAPILSLARKATETISGGMSYAAAPRKPSLGSELEPENNLTNTPKKFTGISVFYMLPSLFLKILYIRIFSEF